MLLLGVRRLRLIRELPPEKPYRVFESEMLDDAAPLDAAAGAATALQRQLLAAFKRAMPKIPQAYEQLDQLLGSQITLGMLTDIVSYTIDLDLGAKGVAVVVEASHTCMTVRGVRKPGSVCVTSAMKGIFRSNVSSRAEVMSLMFGSRQR